MSDWKETRLGVALQIRHGFAFKGEHFRDEGEFIVLTPGNFHESGGFKHKNGKEKYYDGPIPDGFLLRKGDIVVAMTEQARGLLGSSATVPSDGVYLHNQRLGLLQVSDAGCLDLRFCYHLMNTPRVREQLQATATGSKVRHTAPERIEAVRVRLPPVASQARIAAVLDTIDDLIENNRRRVEILEEMARLIFREWFVRFRFPGHEDVELVDSDLGPIPDGWSATILAEHAALERKSVKPADYPDEVFDHYSIPAFDEGQLPMMESGGDIKSGKYQVCGQRVLLSKLNPRFPRAWRVDASQSERRSICSTEFLVLAADHDWPATYLYATVGDIDFGARLAQMAGGTSTSHQRVKPGDVMALPIVGPDVRLAARYDEQVASMLSLADNLIQQNKVLREARDLLLPRLVSGDLDVAEMDLDLAEVG